MTLYAYTTTTKHPRLCARPHLCVWPGVWSLLVANIVHLRVVCIVWCMKRGMVSSESILLYTVGNVCIHIKHVGARACISSVPRSQRWRAFHPPSAPVIADIASHALPGSVLFRCHFLVGAHPMRLLKRRGASRHCMFKSSPCSIVLYLHGLLLLLSKADGLIG